MGLPDGWEGFRLEWLYNASWVEWAIIIAFGLFVIVWG